MNFVHCTTQRNNLRQSWWRATTLYQAAVSPDTKISKVKQRYWRLRKAKLVADAFFATPQDFSPGLIQPETIDICLCIKEDERRWRADGGRSARGHEVTLHHRKNLAFCSQKGRDRRSAWPTTRKYPAPNWTTSWGFSRKNRTLSSVVEPRVRRTTNNGHRVSRHLMNDHRC